MALTGGAAGQGEGDPRAGIEVGVDACLAAGEIGAGGEVGRRQRGAGPGAQAHRARIEAHRALGSGGGAGQVGVRRDDAARIQRRRERPGQGGRDVGECCGEIEARAELAGDIDHGRRRAAGADLGAQAAGLDLLAVADADRSEQAHRLALGAGAQMADRDVLAGHVRHQVGIDGGDASGHVVEAAAQGHRDGLLRSAHRGAGIAGDGVGADARGVQGEVEIGAAGGIDDGAVEPQAANAGGAAGEVAADVDMHRRVRRARRLGGMDVRLDAAGDGLAHERAEVGEPGHAELDGAERQGGAGRQGHVGVSGRTLPVQRVEQHVGAAVGQMLHRGRKRERRAVEDALRGEGALRRMRQMRRVESEMDPALGDGGGADLAHGIELGCEVIDGAARRAAGGERSAQGSQHRLQLGELHAEAGVEDIGEIAAGGVQIEFAAVQVEAVEAQVASLGGGDHRGGETDAAVPADQADCLRPAAGEREGAAEAQHRDPVFIGEVRGQGRVSVERLAGDGGERAELRHGEADPAAQRGRGHDMAGGLGELVEDGEVERMAGLLVVVRGIQDQRGLGQQSRMRARDAHSLGHRMQDRGPGGVAGEAHGQPARAGAFRAQVVEQQGAGADRS